MTNQSWAEEPQHIVVGITNMIRVCGCYSLDMLSIFFWRTCIVIVCIISKDGWRRGWSIAYRDGWWESCQLGYVAGLFACWQTHDELLQVVVIDVSNCLFCLRAQWIMRRSICSALWGDVVAATRSLWSWQSVVGFAHAQLKLIVTRWNKKSKGEGRNPAEHVIIKLWLFIRPPKYNLSYLMLQIDKGK